MGRRKYKPGASTKREWRGGSEVMRRDRKGKERASFSLHRGLKARTAKSLAGLGTGNLGQDGAHVRLRLRPLLS